MKAATGAGASESEIEVTPEMVAAGIMVLPFFEQEVLGTRSEATLVSEVYRAMHAVRKWRKKSSV